MSRTMARILIDRKIGPLSFDWDSANDVVLFLNGDDVAGPALNLAQAFSYWHAGCDQSAQHTDCLGFLVDVDVEAHGEVFPIAHRGWGEVFGNAPDVRNGTQIRRRLREVGGAVVREVLAGVHPVADKLNELLAFPVAAHRISVVHA